MRAEYWSRTYWSDPRLRWNASEFPTVKMLGFEVNEIWRPDEYVYETISLAQTPVLSA